VRARSTDGSDQFSILCNHILLFTPPLPAPEGRLAEAGFTTRTGVTVKITGGYIVLMADHNEMQEFREQVYQVQEAVKELNKLAV